MWREISTLLCRLILDLGCRSQAMDGVEIRVWCRDHHEGIRYSSCFTREYGNIFRDIPAWVGSHESEVAQGFLLPPSGGRRCGNLLFCCLICRRRQYQGVVYPGRFWRSHSLVVGCARKAHGVVRRGRSLQVQLHLRRYPAFREAFFRLGRTGAEPSVSAIGSSVLTLSTIPRSGGSLLDGHTSH